MGENSDLINTEILKENEMKEKKDINGVKQNTTNDEILEKKVETKITDEKDDEKDFEKKENIDKEQDILETNKRENVYDKAATTLQGENETDESARTVEEKYDIESKENVTPTISNGEKEKINDSQEAKNDSFDTLDIVSKKDESIIKKDNIDEALEKKSETSVEDEAAKSIKEELYKSEETTVTTSVKKEVIIETTNKMEVFLSSSKDDLKASEKNTDETKPNHNQVKEEIQNLDVKTDTNEESNSKGSENERSSHIKSNEELSDVSASKSNSIASHEKAPDSFINEIYEVEGRQSMSKINEPVPKISKTEMIDQNLEMEDFKNDKDKEIKK